MSTVGARMRGKGLTDEWNDNDISARARPTSPIGEPLHGDDRSEHAETPARAIGQQSADRQNTVVRWL